MVSFRSVIYPTISNNATVFIIIKINPTGYSIIFKNCINI